MFCVSGHFFVKAAPSLIEYLEGNECTSGRNKRKWPAQTISMFPLSTNWESLIFPQPGAPQSTCLLLLLNTPNSSFSKHLCFSEQRDSRLKHKFPSQCKSVKKQSKADLSLLCRFTWSVSLLPCRGLSLFFVCAHTITSITVFVWFDCAQVCVGMRPLQCQSVAFLLCSLFHCFCSTILFFVGSFPHFLKPT